MSLAQIAQKYGICRRTVIRINQGEVHFNPDETYPMRSYSPPEGKKCNICGKRISHKATICLECSRQTNRPERSILKDLIRQKSFVEIGKMFSVTDNTIKNWCKHYNLPYLRSEIKSIDDIAWQQI